MDTKERALQEIGRCCYDHCVGQGRALLQDGFCVDDFSLIDDGTLDTVVRFEPTEQEIRISAETASEYRDPDTGGLDLEAFVEAECLDALDLDEVRDQIRECALSVELSGTWQLGENPKPERGIVLLGTGGPATRLVCELDEYCEPVSAWIEAQDWFTEWERYRGGSSEDDAALVAFASCFWFGE